MKPRVLAALTIRILDDGRVACDVDNHSDRDAQVTTTALQLPTGRTVLVATFSTYADGLRLDPESGDLYLDETEETP